MDQQDLADPKVTLRDVAEDVGVSVSTVSRTLSGAPGISPSMRRRIHEAAERLGYKGAVKSHSIVVAIDVHAVESGAGEFMQAIQRGIEAQADALGLTISIQHLVAPETAPPVINKAADGYLLLSLQTERLVEGLSQGAMPAVIVNGREPEMRLDAIAPANRTGGYLGTRHLIGLGHRRILFLGHSRRPTIRDRMLGNARALSEAGIAPDPALEVEMSEMRTDVAYRLVSDRLARPGGTDFTAIQCCNDASALGAIAALTEAGLRVPEDVSVIGFDDIPAAGLNSVPLSTLQIDATDLGARGIRRLVERIQDRSQLVTYTETAVSLIPRQSTGPARAA